MCEVLGVDVAREKRCFVLRPKRCATIIARVSSSLRGRLMQLAWRRKKNISEVIRLSLERDLDVDAHVALVKKVAADSCAAMERHYDEFLGADWKFRAWATKGLGAAPIYGSYGHGEMRWRFMREWSETFE